MHYLVDAFHWILHILREPGDLIVWGGLPAMALIIFVETGAMIFFLPGDSLLVVAGLYAAKGDLSMLEVNGLLIPAAIAGTLSSYYLGAKAGPHIFNRPKSRFFNPEHVRAAHAFYEKHGGKAIVIARFMPIVRTFVPIVAGVAKMDYKPYVLFSVAGAALWILSMTCIGYFLGAVVPNIDKHIEKVIIVVVFLSLLPGMIAWARAKFGGKTEPEVAE